MGLFYEYDDTDMVTMLHYVKKNWKRKVTAFDAAIIEDLFLKYDFDPNMVKWLLSYIYERGAVSLSYIYPIADVLKKQGINDSLSAEIFLNKEFDKYKRLLKKMNLFRSIPQKKEKEIIDSWYKKYSENEILEACSVTAAKAKRPSVAYTDAVLKNRKEAE